MQDRVCAYKLSKKDTTGSYFYYFIYYHQSSYSLDTRRTCKTQTVIHTLNQTRDPGILMQKH